MFIEKKHYLILFLIAAAAPLIWFAATRIGHQPQYTIGLIYAPSSTFHDAINASLKSKIAANERFAIKEFTVPNLDDLITISNIVNTALESNIDAIVTTGITCSQVTTQLARRRQSPTPIVFMGISDPVGFGIVDSLQQSDLTITGIASGMPCDENFTVADVLMALKPEAKSVLLPFQVMPDSVEPQAKAVKKALSGYGVKTTVLPISNESDALKLLASKLPGHDVLMYLENDGLATQGPAFGKLASEYGTTMFASSMDGVKDAAISFAANPALLTVYAFNILKKILLEKKRPGDIPVQPAVIKRNVVINLPLCKSQDLATLPTRITETLARIRADQRLALLHDTVVVRN